MHSEEILSEFQSTMRHIAAAVYAITTKVDGQRFGIVATAFSSVSFDPPSILVCINQDASAHDSLFQAERFCVNVLGLANRDVADCFMARKGEERFEIGDWRDEMDVPVLFNAQSNMICKTVDRHRVGTHTIFIGELIGAHHRENAKPLTYYDRRYIDISAATDHAVL